MRDELVLGPVTREVIGAFYDVYNELRYGFLEAVYSRALGLELRQRGLRAAREVHIEVYYKGVEVGDYRADLLVEDRLLVEVKSSRALDASAKAQLRHYLKATGLELGLLLHFGPVPTHHRVVLSHAPRGVHGVVTTTE